MGNYRVTAQGGLNIRSGPGADYEDMGDLAFGDVVESPDTAGWLPIIVADVTGGEDSVCWASVEFLKKYVGATSSLSDSAISAVDVKPNPVIPSTKPTGKAIVAKAMTQNKDPYVFGVEVDLYDPNPNAFDCSELVQWVCAQLHVSPVMPDGASYQYEHCKRYGTIISVSEGVKTVGALLFRLSSSGNHVVISRGDGSTIEAKGSAYGVGVFSTTGRGWSHAALIPGVQYV